MAPTPKTKAIAIVALAAAAAGAPAATESSRDPRAAEELFREAAALMAEGEWTEACPLFEESWNLDPARGALLGVADCHERAGEVASAWAAYQQLRADALAAGDRDRAAIADERIDVLEPRLPQLVIDFAERAGGRLPPDLRAAWEDARAELDIRRGGVSISEIQLGTAIPVDPGSHEVAVRGPSAEAWTTQVEISEGETRAIEIPLRDALSRAAGEVVDTGAGEAGGPERGRAGTPAPSPAPRYDPGGREAQRWLGYSGISGGALSTAAGIAFAVRAYRQYDRYDELCPDDACGPDDDEGARARRHAEGASTLATAFIGVGLVAMTGGVVLWATSPSSNRSAVGARALRVEPYARPAEMGAALTGRF